MSYDLIESSDPYAKPIKAWTRGVPVEEQAKNQLRNMARLPFIFSHIAVMPDVHFGIGATVGSVIATKGAIVPAAVGVDIGCGMNAVKTTLTANDLPDSLADLRSKIERAVPHGGQGASSGWGGKPGGTPNSVRTAWRSALEPNFTRLCSRFPGFANANAEIHLGSLGSGNHFIELCLDEEDRVWVMLHSGSRGIGNAIGRFFIERARESFVKAGVNLPDKDLAWFTQSEPVFHEYVGAMLWAQQFAAVNRDVMMERVLGVMHNELPGFNKTGLVVSCHHNYASKESHFGEDVWLTRKGAVDASDGRLGIIPGSMGTGSFIVRGRGNPDSFHSCSHGAGRAMSRGAAKRTITLDEHKAAMAGIEARIDEGVLDESPAAYKDLNAVMAAQADLVEIVHRLKPVLNIKG